MIVYDYRYVLGTGERVAEVKVVVDPLEACAVGDVSQVGQPGNVG